MSAATLPFDHQARPSPTGTSKGRIAAIVCRVGVAILGLATAIGLAAAPIGLAAAVIYRCARVVRDTAATI